MSDQILRNALDEAKETIREQDEMLRQLTAPPYLRGVVIRPPKPNDKQLCLISQDGKLLELVAPANVQLRAGMQLRLNAQTMGIVEVLKEASLGEIGSVLRTMPATNQCEVEVQGTTRVVSVGLDKAPVRGDRVVVDETCSVITQNLGKEQEAFAFTGETSVSWEDIGGLRDAKEQMIEAIELPHKHPDLYKKYGKKPIKGVLLYGPPGCGKTMLAKATATALSKVHGQKTSTGFIYVKGPEILSKFVGTSEATIRGLFERAREHKKKHGYPAVLFVDEADAILSRRGTGISSDIEKTIVPMFLAEMDGMDDSGAVVLLATNRPDVLDPAVVRDGRVDRKVRVTRPEVDGAAEIFSLNLKGKPLIDHTPKEYARFCAGELYADKHELYEINLRSGNTLKVKLSHLVNGAMIAGVVDQATTLAMRRDIAHSGKGKCGLTKEDATEAIASLLKQNRDLDHTDELQEFTHDFRKDVVGVNKIRHAATA
jgi:proteasome-associated ATPase